MILGTVELGLEYGINNKTGKPSYDEANRILDIAWENGIKELDTAAAYGDSEKIIGAFQKKTGRRFLIDTKLPFKDSGEKVREAFECSRENLSGASINILYLHAFEMCQNGEIMEGISALKEEGSIAKIGISVYEPDELRYITDCLPQVDAVQIPINMFSSRRWRRNDVLKNAYDRGIRILARSLYLQGLVFMVPQNSFAVRIGATPYLEHVQELCKTWMISPAELSYSYVCSIPEIDDVLLGCETSQQILDNIMIENGRKMLTELQIEEIEEKMRDIPDLAIDPRKWEIIK